MENGILPVKLFLHVSREEQRLRLLKRIDSEDQQWQFSEADVEGHLLWDEHMQAYSEALTRTNTEHAPWHVVPADLPWHARAAVAAVVVKTLAKLHAGYPKPSEEQSTAMEKAREALRAR